MAQRSAPGPVGTSCLTCKRRHKKCDMRQPNCLRCEEGEFECLGYSHIRCGVTRPAPSKVFKLRRIMPKGQGTDLSLVQPAAPSSGSKPSGGEGHSDKSSSSELESSNVWSVNPPPPSGVCRTSLGTPVQRRDHSISTLTTRDYLQLFSPKSYQRQTTGSPPSLHQLCLIFNRLPSSPSDPTMVYLNSPEFVTYISSHFNRMIERAYFKPMNDQREQIRNLVISRLRSSHLSRWTTLLGARIGEAIIDGDHSQTQLHIRWIGDVETVVQRRLAQDPPPKEAENLRRDWIELSLLKTTLGQSSNAYAVLRRATPMFLQTVYSLPDLWPSDSDLTLIPLMRIMGSGNHTLASFVLMDSVCAMIFGMPPQVEYDTNTGLIPKDFLPHEWAHTSPIEFLILLADINACRVKSVGMRDWKEIEHVLVNWQTQPIRDDAGWESWMIVAWLAVQESWRLALLAYLYLAVCGCSSDDVRIQRCITQVVQVAGTVKKHESPDATVQFLIQYLMVGICARSENHRKIVRKKLSDVNETKLWMMRGADFIPVLDHLWHGAGSGGHPVTWADYVRSREALLPISL
ncbi:unnamed protein product [Rhizoctonia solani]|uniref:Zn(2)-C6 fungal-type domain-containing protein n=1 Tax=Rhizoctonia solani TaxID=456999 RepID=A0A8H2XN71_9AGAM|nr:unnamed protein product [Rhizoctonia solani]